jgi:hypothetical protein
MHWRRDNQLTGRPSRQTLRRPGKVLRSRREAVSRDGNCGASALTLNHPGRCGWALAAAFEKARVLRTSKAGAVPGPCQLSPCVDSRPTATASVKSGA